MILRIIATVVAATLAMPLLGGVPARADQQRDAQWYLKRLDIAAAHQLSEGAGVIVAVIDTGVYTDRADLEGAVLPGFDVTASGDGLEDELGHGTAMAGIIAARGRAADRGLLGIAPRAKILPIRPASGPLIVSKAIEWAVDHGAKVINMSFAVQDGKDLAAAVAKALKSDVVLVAATGNDGEEGIDGDYPAAYPEVLAVGASGRRGEVTPFSHQGPQLDLVAPGIDIPVVGGKLDSEYRTVEGTSASTAIVSGAAALVRSKYPELSAAEVVKILESTASDKGPAGRDDTYGYGELNILAALKAAATTEPSQPSPPTPSRPGVIVGSGDGDSETLPSLAIIGFAALVLAGAVTALVIGIRRR
ncbi:S8 family serine peptidase [Actinoplanes sp. NPDC049599]|uniref:S8 family serine peptidase n=1 Tax=Actinoplanes sp. NPDC049599 TaxID=3363903 RepID=UPI0037BE1EFA